MSKITKVFFAMIAVFGVVMCSVVFGAESRVLFGMDCKITKIPLVGKPQKVIFSTGDYAKELAQLKQKGYTRIDLIREYIINGQVIKLLLGEKCGHDVVRINGLESINNLGVDHIKKVGDTLYMYGATRYDASMITCTLSSMTGNVYKPFASTETGNIQTGNIQNPQQSETGISMITYPIKTVVLHPQDKRNLLYQPVSTIVNVFGGVWKQARKILASEIGIQGYHGSRIQNLLIKKYLLSKIETKAPTTNTQTIEVTQGSYNQLKSDVVSRIATLWKYVRSYDRWSLFEELGNESSQYLGSKRQNIQIRQYLLTKIKIKN